MSAFGDEVRGDLVGIFTDAGDLADYRGASIADGIRVVLDRDWEVYDENQVSMRVTTISIQIADVATSQQGDTISTSGRTWTVQEVLEDDGYLRRLWVS